MKKSILSLFVGLMAAIMMTTAAFAEYVYVTKNGKKYHHAESRFIKNRETEKLTLEEAKELGFEPSQAYLKYKERLKQEEAQKE